MALLARAILAFRTRKEDKRDDDARDVCTYPHIPTHSSSQSREPGVGGGVLRPPPPRCIGGWPRISLSYPIYRSHLPMTTTDPFDNSKSMQAANLEDAVAPFQGVPTMDGSQCDILAGPDGYAYMRIAPIAGNVLLQKLTSGGLEQSDLPKNSDGSQRDRTGICAIRRDIYPFLSGPQKEAADARHEASPYYRPNSKPKVWAGDTLITLKSGVVVRCHLLVELAKDARSQPNDEVAGEDTVPD